MSVRKRSEGSSRRSLAAASFLPDSPEDSSSSTRRSSSRAALSNQLSSASLRASPTTTKSSKGQSLASAFGADGDNGADFHDTTNSATLSNQFSLAHELAAALMPEPSAGSKLLAEEFGIEFEEGAEGIDDASMATDPSDTTLQDGGASFDANGHNTMDSLSNRNPPDILSNTPSRHDTTSSPSSSRTSFPSSQPLSSTSDPQQESSLQLDPIEQLKLDHASTDEFLIRLRCLDSEPASMLPLSSLQPARSIPPLSNSFEPPVERYTSRIIRQLNDIAKERENQVRELAGYEREFRKIGGELGGFDVLASLDPLEDVEGLMDGEESSTPAGLSTTITPITPSRGHLQPLTEDDEDEDIDPLLRDNPSVASDEEGPSEDDEDDVFGGSSSQPSRSRRGGGPRRGGRASARRQKAQSDDPSSTELPSPPPTTSPPTPSSTIPHLSHMRSVTNSLVYTLSSISEHAQENSAATADAGRKLRALRNRLMGWRAEWESAEKSKERIEKWEEEGKGKGGSPPRVDGRQIVEEELKAFQKVLDEANRKTQAIMAAA